MIASRGRTGIAWAGVFLAALLSCGDDAGGSTGGSGSSGGAMGGGGDHEDASAVVSDGGDPEMSMSSYPRFVGYECPLRRWQAGEGSDECAICRLDFCCEELHWCGLAVSQLGDRLGDVVLRASGCELLVHCADLCVRDRLQRDSLDSPNEIIADCVHGCRAPNVAGMPMVPAEDWPEYEPMVAKVMECYLSAPAVIRTDDDAGLLWEPIDEAAGDAWPRGCFRQCDEQERGRQRP